MNGKRFSTIAMGLTLLVAFGSMAQAVPLTVTSDLELRLETVGSGAVTTSGSLVTSWNDQAGTADNAVVGVPGGNYPTLLTNATPMGTSSLKFDGNNDYMDVNDVSNLATQTVTWFTVYKVDTFPSWDMFQTKSQVILRCDTNADDALWGNFITTNTDHSQQIRSHSRSSTHDLISAVTPFSDTSEWHIISSVWNGTDTELNGNVATSVSGRLDGASMGTNTGANANPTVHNYLRIGASPNGPNPGGFDFNGQVAAVLVYTTALSAQDIQSVETYLQDTYITPEPATMSLLVIGGIALLRKRKTQR